MRFLRYKIDWWFVNGIFWIISGLLIIITGFLIFRVINWEIYMRQFLLEFFLGGFINIILGVWLLHRNRIVFWVVLISATFMFVNQIVELVSSLARQDLGSLVILPFLSSMIGFVLIVLLWQQKRAEIKDA